MSATVASQEVFAAFLGYNPVQHLIGSSALAHLTAAQRAALNGRSFFPGLISGPFQTGLRATFDFAILASLIGAAASWTRGGRYVYREPGDPDGAEVVDTVAPDEEPVHVAGAVLTSAQSVTIE